MAPVYGADVSHSLFEPDVAGAWNLNRLESILNEATVARNVSLAGVNTSYLYFGMWKTTFGWHTEDMDLYSINYHHFGAAKTWYAVAPGNGRAFEQLAARLFPEDRQRCAAHLRHKSVMIDPQVLRRNGVPCERIEQQAGEFVVTFPYGYHAGFNQGFNCAEAVNFATERWIEFGKRSAQCLCARDSVRIDMDGLVRKYQPERWEAWSMGAEAVGEHPAAWGGCGDGGWDVKVRDVKTVQMPKALR